MDERWEDDREMMDVPASEPVGSATVTFAVPMPTAEQVTGEIARQILATGAYNQRSMLEHKAAEAIDDLIGKIIEERARPIIETLLDTPLRPTDQFGNATGEPISLIAVLAKRVTEWKDDVIDLHGKVSKRDQCFPSHYSTRLERSIHDIVNKELAEKVSAETRAIVASLKTGATKDIAEQIAKRIEGMVFK